MEGVAKDDAVLAHSGKKDWVPRGNHEGDVLRDHLMPFSILDAMAVVVMATREVLIVGVAGVVLFLWPF